MEGTTRKELLHGELTVYGDGSYTFLGSPPMFIMGSADDLPARILDAREMLVRHVAQELEQGGMTGTLDEWLALHTREARAVTKGRRLLTGLGIDPDELAVDWDAPDGYPPATDMACERHPWVQWPHGDCAGPGMPWTEGLAFLARALRAAAYDR